jgi:putative copper export protein
MARCVALPAATHGTAWRASVRLVMARCLVLLIATAPLGAVAWTGGPVSAQQSPQPTIDPADGSQLVQSPTEIRVQLPTAAGFGTVAIQLADTTNGTQVALNPVEQSADGTRAVATLVSALAPGEYRADVTVATAGYFSVFTVVAPAATTVPPDAADTTPPQRHQLPAPFPGVVRFAGLCLFALLAGSLVMVGVAFPPLQREGSARRLLAIGYGGSLLVAALTVVDASDRLDSVNGRAYLARLVLLVVLPFAVVLGGRLFETAEVALGGLVVVALAATFPIGGHGWDQRWRNIGILLDTAHTLAMGVWLGAVVMVAGAVLGRFRTGDAAAIGRRFAAVSAVAIPVLIVTGIAQTVQTVGSPSALLDSTHGRWILLKSLIAAVVLVSASATGRQIRTMRSERRAFAIRQAMGTQTALAVVIVAIAAAAVVATPATQPPAAPPAPDLPTVTFPASSQSVFLDVAVTPGWVGANDVMVTPTAESAQIGDLTLEAFLSGQPTVSATFGSDGDSFVAEGVTFPVAGSWTLRFVVSGRDPISAVLSIVEPPATTTAPGTGDNPAATTPTTAAAATPATDATGATISAAPPSVP